MINCGGGGFRDPIDPDPLANPNPGPPGNPNEEPTTTTTSCSTVTVTDFLVSCTSIDTTSTYCSTTSSLVVSGCQVTATTTTTGVAACYSIDPSADQGEDGYPLSARPTTSGSGTPPPPITSSPTTPAYSAGLAIAAYTICQGSPYVCEYQWEIFDADPPRYTYPGCSTNGALYSSVFDSFASATGPPPPLGTFSTHGKTGCTYHDNLLSCVPDALCYRCGSVFEPNYLAGCGYESCSPNLSQLYNTDVICVW